MRDRIEPATDASSTKATTAGLRDQVGDLGSPCMRDRVPASAFRVRDLDDPTIRIRRNNIPDWTKYRSTAFVDFGLLAAN